MLLKGQTFPLKVIFIRSMLGLFAGIAIAMSAIFQGKIGANGR
jgi:hypothetical protein